MTENSTRVVVGLWGKTAPLELAGAAQNCSRRLENHLYHVELVILEYVARIGGDLDEIRH